VLAPVLVIEPASHAVHALTLELVEYLLAGQDVHVFAPVAVPLSVTEPAPQLSQ
jgi:hypothetical protein